MVGARVKDYFRSQAQTWAAHPKKRAMLLDVDDTSLVTYDYEIYSNFVYNPPSTPRSSTRAVFPGITATRSGRGLRPSPRRDGDLPDRASRGAARRAPWRTSPRPATPVPTDHLFLKDQTNPSWLSSCSPTCTTIQYKSLTRKHIEDDLGYKIVANVGDQVSDLSGGYANKDYKLPNPMYYLP